MDYMDLDVLCPRTAVKLPPSLLPSLPPSLTHSLTSRAISLGLGHLLWVKKSPESIDTFSEKTNNAHKHICIRLHVGLCCRHRSRMRDPRVLLLAIDSYCILQISLIILQVSVYLVVEMLPTWFMGSTSIRHRCNTSMSDRYLIDVDPSIQWCLLFGWRHREARSSTTRWCVCYWRGCLLPAHYKGVIMGAIASQITSLATVYSSVYSGADQSKH